MALSQGYIRGNGDVTNGQPDWEGRTFWSVLDGSTECGGLETFGLTLAIGIDTVASEVVDEMVWL